MPCRPDPTAYATTALKTWSPVRLQLDTIVSLPRKTVRDARNDGIGNRVLREWDFFQTRAETKSQRVPAQPLLFVVDFAVAFATTLRAGKRGRLG